MANRRIPHPSQEPPFGLRRLASESLKRCPLCGAVNAVSNGECFQCAWHGRFSHDPDEIEAGIGDLIARCPELVDALWPMPAPKRTSLGRLRDLLNRIVRRRIDVRV